ncbi:MAG: SPOR domain-containing protein [Novosphingobium sp.]
MTGIDGTQSEDQWEAEGGHTASESLETEQLELTDDDNRLPWLEGSDGDDDEYDGSDNGAMMKLIAMGLVTLVVLVGAIWWATHRNPDAALVPDGSLVQAESGSYKEAPKNPGGKQFDGTGDSSFAVSEGQTRPAQLGGTDKAPAPAPAANPDPTARPGVTAPQPAVRSVGVQVGAYSSRSAAEAGWSKLVGQANGALSGVSHRVIEGSADNGTIYRLQAVAGDEAAAHALCGKLKSAGVSCQVK